MFAFVLATKTRIIAARDPLGIKPLYMARIGDGLAFASELKAFDGVAVDAVESIGPGMLYDSRDGLRQWYRTPHGAAEEEPGLDIEAVAGELRLVLEEAVAKWMLADVEVGSFLSGGLDSSIIAALAARLSPRPLKTFAVGTEGSADLRAAREVARHIGSDHYEDASRRKTSRGCCPMSSTTWKAPTWIWCAPRCPPISPRASPGGTSRRC